MKGGRRAGEGDERRDEGSRGEGGGVMEGVTVGQQSRCGSLSPRLPPIVSLFSVSGLRSAKAAQRRAAPSLEETTEQLQPVSESLCVSTYVYEMGGTSKRSPKHLHSSVWPEGSAKSGCKKTKKKRPDKLAHFFSLGRVKYRKLEVQTIQP